MTNNRTIIKISGTLVVAKGLSGTRIYDMVRVGRFKLFEDVVELLLKTSGRAIWNSCVSLTPHGGRKTK